MNRKLSKIIIFVLCVFHLNIHASFWSDVGDAVGGAVSWVGDGVSWVADGIKGVGNWISGNSGVNASGGSYSSSYYFSSASTERNDHYAGVLGQFKEASDKRSEIERIVSANGQSLDRLEADVSKLISGQGVIKRKLQEVLSRIDDVEKKQEVMNYFLQKSVFDNIHRDVTREIRNDIDNHIVNNGNFKSFLEKQMLRVGDALTDDEKRLRLSFVSGIMNNLLSKAKSEGNLSVFNETVLALEQHKSDLEKLYDLEPNLRSKLNNHVLDLSISTAKKDRALMAKEVIERLKKSRSKKSLDMDLDDYEKEMGRAISRTKQKIEHSEALKELFSKWEKAIGSKFGFAHVESLENEMLKRMKLEGYSDRDLRRAKELFTLSKRKVYASIGENTLENIDQDIKTGEKEIESLVANYNRRNVQDPCEVILENKVVEIRNEYFKIKTKIVLNKLAYAYFDGRGSDERKKFESIIKELLKSNELKDEEAKQKALSGIIDDTKSLNDIALNDILKQIMLHQKDRERSLSHLSDSDRKFLVLANQINPKEVNLAGFAAMINTQYAKPFLKENKDTVNSMVKSYENKLIDLNKQLASSLDKYNCSEYFDAQGLPICMVLNHSGEASKKMPLLFEMQKISKYLNNTTGDFLNPTQDKVFSEMILSSEISSIDFDNQRVPQSKYPYKDSRSEKGSQNISLDALSSSIVLGRDNSLTFSVNTEVLASRIEKLLSDKDIIGLKKLMDITSDKRYENVFSKYLDNSETVEVILGALKKPKYSDDQIKALYDHFSKTFPEKYERAYLKVSDPELFLYIVEDFEVFAPRRSIALAAKKKFAKLSPNKDQIDRLDKKLISEGDLTKLIFRELDSRDDILKLYQQYPNEQGNDYLKQKSILPKLLSDDVKRLIVEEGLEDDYLVSSLVTKVSTNDDEIIDFLNNEKLMSLVEARDLKELLDGLSKDEKSQEKVLATIKDYLKDNPNISIDTFYSTLIVHNLDSVKSLFDIGQFSGASFKELPPKAYFNRNPVEDFVLLTEQFDIKYDRDDLAERGLADTQVKDEIIKRLSVDNSKKYLNTLVKSDKIGRDEISNPNTMRLYLSTRSVDDFNFLIENEPEFIIKYSKGAEGVSLAKNLPKLSTGVNLKQLLALSAQVYKNLETNEQRQEFKDHLRSKIDIGVSSSQIDVLLGKVLK